MLYSALIYNCTCRVCLNELHVIRGRAVERVWQVEGDECERHVVSVGGDQVDLAVQVWRVVRGVGRRGDVEGLGAAAKVVRAAAHGWKE